ncbi:putative magnesium transporter NIPA6 [Bienertia sinuspersici]
MRFQIIIRRPFEKALSSSGFIGASFIIKKKGYGKLELLESWGYSYLFEPLWWLGLCMMIIGEIAIFVAYAICSSYPSTPLGALSIIVRKVKQIGVPRLLMCIVGSVIIVIHAPQEHTITSVQEIWNMATQMAFLLYAGSVIVLVFILIIYFAPLCGHSNVLVFTGICFFDGFSLGGAYAPPMSPTLTAGLCAGNSEFRKTDWDDAENPEVVLLSRSSFS